MSNLDDYDDVHVRAATSTWWDRVDLLVRGRQPIVDGGQLVAGTSIVMTPVEPGEVGTPTLRLSKSAAQTLMDDLWNSGIRPTEGSGSAGAMRAVERHVDDLRKIAFKTLDIPEATER